MTDIFSENILVRLERGGILESHHDGHLVILSSDGDVKFSIGNLNELIYPRSSIKAIQAAAMLRAGLTLEPRLLALVAASHSGSATHQSAVQEILAISGLDETSLRNAIDKPLGEEEQRAWGERPATSLAQNCSGKHAGMLVTCAVNGWSTEHYLSPTHPLQEAIKRELETLADESISTISVDGCGAPLFLLSLAGVAKSIHALTTSPDRVHKRVIEACRSFPEMVAGEGRSTTRFMRSIPGLFLKEGAEGVGVGSMPDGRTFAFKISDGSHRPYPIVVSACLKHLDVLTEAETTPVFGGSAIVGALTSSF